MQEIITQLKGLLVNAANRMYASDRDNFDLTLRDIQALIDQHEDSWISVDDLPEGNQEEILMVLNGDIQVCCEFTSSEHSQRWFCGQLSGAYPLDEIDLWQPIPPVGAEQ